MSPNGLSFFDASSKLLPALWPHLVAESKYGNAMLQIFHVNFFHRQWNVHAPKPDAPTPKHFSADIAQRLLSWSPTSLPHRMDVNGYQFHRHGHPAFAWSSVT